MNKLILTITILLGACAGRPQVQATPAQRAQVIGLYLGGATSKEIGERFSLGRDETRELIRDTIRSLHRMYCRRR